MRDNLRLWIPKWLMMVGIAFLLLPTSVHGYWHVSYVNYIGSVDGRPNSFSFPEEYHFVDGTYPVDVTTHNSSGGCPGGGSCDTVESLAFRQQYYCPNFPCGTYNANFCGKTPPGWDSAAVTVPMPRSASSYVFWNPDNGAYYPHAMFHMSQAIPGCNGTQGSGLFGSFGIDFSYDGRNWIQYSHNPVLTDSKLSASPLSFPAGSSAEKGEVIFYNNIYYMMAIVANTSSGCENCLECGNTRTLTYLLYSYDAVTWYRATYGSNTTGLVTSNGIVYPPNAYGPWLINVNMAYDPATDTTYMTRAYRSNSTCPNLGILPDRVQVYKAVGGIPAILTGTWQLLIDLGCNSTQPYQQALNFAPDSAQIRHNGVGLVQFNGGGGLTLMMSNGNTTSCNPTAPTGVYEVWILP